MVDRTLPASDFEQEREVSPEAVRAVVLEATRALEALQRLEQQDAWKAFTELMRGEQARVLAEIARPCEPHVMAHLSGQLAAYQQLSGWFQDQVVEAREILTQQGAHP